MAVTVTQAITGDQAGYAPIILAGTTSRDPQGYTRSLTGYGNTSGYLAVSFASGGATFENNDTVIISGATGSLAQYNGRHTVYSVTATSIRTNTAWNGGTTAAVGTLTRANTNFQMRFDIYDGSSVLQSRVYAPAVAGAFSVDLAPQLARLTSTIWTQTAGAVDTSNASAAFTVSIAETWLTDTYEAYELIDALKNQAGTVHRTTSVASIATTALLNNSTMTVQEGATLLVHFLTNKTSGVRVYFTTASGTTEVAVTITRKHGAAAYTVPTGAKYVSVLVVWFNGSENEAIKDYLKVRVLPQHCGYTVYFLNRLGGFTSVEFPDKELSTDTDRVDRYTTRSYNVLTLGSVEESRGRAAYFRDLVDSPEIYINGVEVPELLDSRLKYYGDNVQLQIEVRDEQSYIY
jgi:hypothetical protein